MSLSLSSMTIQKLEPFSMSADIMLPEFALMAPKAAQASKSVDSKDGRFAPLIHATFTSFDKGLNVLIMAGLIRLQEGWSRPWDWKEFKIFLPKISACFQSLSRNGARSFSSICLQLKKSAILQRILHKCINPFRLTAEALRAECNSWSELFMTWKAIGRLTIISILFLKKTHIFILFSQRFLLITI